MLYVNFLCLDKQLTEVEFWKIKELVGWNVCHSYQIVLWSELLQKKKLNLLTSYLTTKFGSSEYLTDAQIHSGQEF